MSQWEKLLYKLKKLSPDMRFEELQKILESYGYECNLREVAAAIFRFAKKAKLLLPFPSISR